MDTSVFTSIKSRDILLFVFRLSSHSSITTRTQETSFPTKAAYLTPENPNPNSFDSKNGFRLRLRLPFSFALALLFSLSFPFPFAFSI